MTSADVSQKRTNESPYKAVLYAQHSVTIKNEIIIEKEEQGTYEERKKKKGTKQGRLLAGKTELVNGHTPMANGS